MGERISTSVDELMNLISETEKISFKDAAKKLGVQVSTIEGWAALLEEEHVVSIDYSFGKPYLVKKILTETQKKSKVKRFDEKKNVLFTKIDMTSSFFSELDEHLEDVTKVVSSVTKHMDDKLAHINQDLADLAKAEKEKEKIDQKIIESKQNSLSRVEALEKKILAAESRFEKSYKGIRSELDKDTSVLKKGSSFLENMKKQEALIRDKIKEVQHLSANLTVELSEQDKLIEDTESHLAELQLQRKALADELDVEHAELVSVLQENHKQEELIETMQKDLYDKIDRDEKILTQKSEEAKHVPKQIKDLLVKKRKMADLLSQITHAETEAKHEIEQMKAQAMILRKSIGVKDVDKELAKIQKELADLSKKKTFFQDKITELLSAVKMH